MIVERVTVSVPPGFLENCYLVSDDRGATRVAVIDPGGQPEEILRALDGRVVDSIILTHGHFDHIGAVTDLVETTGAVVIAHSLEADSITGAIDNGPRSITKLIKPVTVDRVVDDGDIIQVGEKELKIYHTPGHTIGSMCLYDSEDHQLLAGDTLFFEAVGRTDFPTGSAVQQRESIARLFELPDDTRVYPGHDEDTTIGHEKVYGPLADIV